MRISIITVCYNAEATIVDTIKSVLMQTHSNIEHIIIDGASTDGTLEIIKKYEQYITAWISEADQGIYDAMNKGIVMATGDVIGILNADDIYAHNGVVSRIAEVMSSPYLDVCFADLDFVKKRQVVRHYSSEKFYPSRLQYGWMPAHPTLYMRKELFDKVGMFRTDYLIAADYEWVIRAFISHQARWEYIPETWVKMRTGGVSTRSLKNRWVLNSEIVRACKENGVNTNIFKILMKVPLKLLEFRILK